MGSYDYSTPKINVTNDDRISELINRKYLIDDTAEFNWFINEFDEKKADLKKLIEIETELYGDRGLDFRMHFDGQPAIGKDKIFIQVAKGDPNKISNRTNIQFEPDDALFENLLFIRGNGKPYSFLDPDTNDLNILISRNEDPPRFY